MDRYEYQPAPVEQLADYLNTSEGREFTFHPTTLVRNAICELYAIKKNSASVTPVPDLLERLETRIRSLEIGERKGTLGTEQTIALTAYRLAVRSLSNPDQPWPVVPTFDEWLESSGQKPLGWVKEAMRESYDGCRNAVLTSKTP